MRLPAWLGLCALLCACHSGGGEQATMTREQLLDPSSCQGCHPDQYSEWAGSMHAYASNDPVFLAMNRRGQRETNGSLGKFCVNCHAPLAVREGLTTDGLNLDQVPQNMKGVTCFFCHTVQSVDGAHDNPLTLANDGVLRGAISDPAVNGRPHGSAYSPLLDRDRAESATTCGSCHDIVNGHGAAIERTFNEWKSSAFDLVSGTTCGQCHMPQSTELKQIAAVQDAPLRRSHGHTWPGVDLALTPFPDTARQLDQVQSLLSTTLQSAICLEEGFGSNVQMSLIIDNVAAGHSFPSGAEQDRRAYAEVIAYQGSNVVYQSGVVPPGTGAAGSTDPDIWVMRDCMFDQSGGEVHMFWEAFSYQTNGLPALITFDPTSPDFYKGHKQKFFPKDGSLIPRPDRVTLRVMVEAVGYDVIDNLIASKDLDSSVRDAFKVLQVGNTLEWTQAKATHTYLNRTTGNTVFCATDTNINVTADRFPADVRTMCSP